MFDRIPDLKGEIRHLKDYSKKLEQVNRELRERAKLFENGIRCDGEWCDHCEHFGGYKMMHDEMFSTDFRSICLKDVPCPDFVRREAPKPHD